MTRLAARRRDDERALHGEIARAWLAPGQDHLVGRGRVHDRVAAQLALDAGWLLVVSPRSSAAERAQDDATRAAIADPVERESWTPPAWRRGEVCRAVQCPRCGHRLSPRSRVRRSRHDAGLCRGRDPRGRQT